MGGLCWFRAQSEFYLGACPEPGLMSGICSVAYSANEYRKILKSTSMVSEGDRVEWSMTPPPKVVYHDDGDWRTEVRVHAPLLSDQNRDPHKLNSDGLSGMNPKTIIYSV